MERIRFKINYKVKQKRKFEEFLDRYEEEIGLEFKELKIKRYVKVEEQFQANFFIESNSTEKQKIVYEILIWANKLSSKVNSNWIINGPYENEILIFECILNNDKNDHPLKWAHIEIENE